MIEQTKKDYTRADKIHYDDKGKFISPSRWRPSIHMPRWCCRLYQELTHVKPIRLHMVSLKTAMREGVPDYLYGDYDTSRKLQQAPFMNLIRLWEELYGGSKLAFDNDPWVWSLGTKLVTDLSEEV